MYNKRRVQNKTYDTYRQDTKKKTRRPDDTTINNSTVSWSLKKKFVPIIAPLPLKRTLAGLGGVQMCCRLDELEFKSAI
jgi:hypothetical protein